MILAIASIQTPRLNYAFSKVVGKLAFSLKLRIYTFWSWPIRSLEFTLKYVLNAQNRTKTLLIPFRRRDVLKRKYHKAKSQSSPSILLLLSSRHHHALYHIVIIH